MHPLEENPTPSANKTFLCPLTSEWIKFREELSKTMQQVSDLHGLMPDLVSNMSYLSDIATHTKEMKESLVGAVVGKDQIPASMAEKNMDSYRKIMISTIAALSFAFTIIIVTLIGAKTLIPNIFPGGTP
jgi:hypothetical protein